MQLSKVCSVVRGEKSQKIIPNSNLLFGGLCQGAQISRGVDVLGESKSGKLPGIR